MLILTIFVLCWGNFLSFPVLLNPLYSQFSPTKISIISICFVIAGMVGLYSIGHILDKTRKYQFCMRIITLAASSISMGIIYVISIDSVWINCVVVTFFGLFLVPIMTVAYALANRVTGTVPPAAVDGIMMCSAHVMGIVLTSLYLVVIVKANGNAGKTLALSIVSATLLTAFVCSLFVKQVEKSHRGLLQTNSHRLGSYGASTISLERT